MGLFQEEKRKEILLQSSIFKFRIYLSFWLLGSLPLTLTVFSALFLLLFRCPIFVLFSFFFAALFRCPISHFSAANYPLCWLLSFVIIFSLFLSSFCSLSSLLITLLFCLFAAPSFLFLQPLFAALFAPFRSTFLPLFLLIALTCLAFSFIFEKDLKKNWKFKTCI